MCIFVFDNNTTFVHVVFVYFVDLNTIWCVWCTQDGAFVFGVFEYVFVFGVFVVWR